MALRDDIVDGDRLEEILVRVVNAEEHFTSSLAWSLTVEDTAGNEFQVKIWNTHDVNSWWREGWQYVLKEGRGRHRGDGEIVLHSTDDFTVCRPRDVVDLLAIGDSHIGREKRPRDSGAPYRTARQFVAAMGYAARYDVNAVIHAGDLFDDKPGPEDLKIAESGFKILEQNAIPFYFIFGNHGVDVAKSFINDVDGVETSHLKTEGVHIGGQLGLFGIDYESTESFKTTATGFAAPPDLKYRILVMHHEVDPPRKNSEMTVEWLSASLGVEFDYILSGHLHDPESGEWRETRVQYLGSTADISTKKSAEGRLAWLIRVSPTGIDTHRLKLE